MANTRESLLARLNPGQPNECWLWSEAINRDGYGRVRFEGKVQLAHRLFYEFLVGPIPEGMELDHTCHTPECVGRGGCQHRRCANPAHLRPVVPAENKARRAVSGPERNASTHCRNGHEFTPENTAYSRGYRVCRACRNASKRRYRRRQ
jgi:hypothetical protein